MKNCDSIELGTPDVSPTSCLAGGVLVIDPAIAAGMIGPEALSPLFPVLLLAVVAAHKMRQYQRHPYGRNSAFRRRESANETLADSLGWQLAETQFCPICCAEYLGGTERCEDCAVQLVDEDELPNSDLRIEEGIVRIASLRNSTHGHLVRGYFSSNRIPCSLVRCTPCDVFGTDVYVFESDALRAKRLLRYFLADMERC